ncbi:hypothetical protein NRY68_05790 [Acidithiobacillus ferrooxidans]|uniref:hypothetical protein n=1 Tax=Acidithiobacillus ferrooxidans TaxID=920 RepID=UPI0021480DFD|nr:hypothetical protein [Acidithiobacillus ferrooxidans]MCR1345318.1 hypothetical protein [Acidithiobacillus ferrooxidans]MCR1354478.1 hypothetical protein [Acidithiobacillus ferrooxidans]
MNSEQKKHLASVLNVVALAQFGVFGYTAFIGHPIDWVRLAGSTLEFMNHFNQLSDAILLFGLIIIVISAVVLYFDRHGKKH